MDDSSFFVGCVSSEQVGGMGFLTFSDSRIPARARHSVPVKPNQARIKVLGSDLTKIYAARSRINAMQFEIMTNITIYLLNFLLEHGAIIERSFFSGVTARRLLSDLINTLAYSQFGVYLLHDPLG